MYKIGIVGLPNVGKSLLFNLLSGKSVPSENYPFCTIKPNSALVPYVDDKLTALSLLTKSKKTVYSVLELVDIAGLVKGASDGAGLGNEFLSAIRNVDLIVHVVRSFDEKVTHVEGSIDPIRDFEIISMELLLSDLKIIEKMKIKHAKDINKMKELNDIEQKLYAGVKDLPKEYGFISSKPMIVLINGEKLQMDQVKFIEQMTDYCKEKQIECLNFSFFNIEKPENDINLKNLIEIGFEKLNLISFFTTGAMETRSWTIESGSTALKAAGKIHSDFEKKFICAKTIDYSEYMCGKRLFISRSKEYIIQHRQIIEFMIGK